MKSWKLSVFAVFTVVITLLSTYRIFQNYELIFYDLRLQLRPLQKVSEDIAIIEIGDETLRLLGQWPLPRDFHASLVDILSEVGAKSIIIDFIFSEQIYNDESLTSYDKFLAESDKLLAESFERAHNVYLPMAFEDAGSFKSQEIILKPQKIIAPIAKFLEGSVYQKGHINRLIDPDGKTRRMMLFINEGSGVVGQLGLMVACNYLKLDCSNIKFSKSRITLDEKLEIPVFNHNELIINYPGTWKDSFKHFSYFQILKEYQLWKAGQGDMGILKQLKDKVSFIGFTATGSVDLQATPLETHYPMVGIHASIFNSIIQNKFIRKMSTEANTIINVLVFFATLIICIRFSPLVSFVGSVLLTALYFSVATGLLIYYGIWIDLFFPLMIIFATYVSCVSLRWVNEIQQRQVMEKELNIAQDIQKQFLVGLDQEIKNLNIETWFQPAKFVAGDLYDITRIDENKTGLLIGDVSGKGLPAALLMAQAVSLFRVLSKQLSKPHALLKWLNAELCERSGGRFVTALYCIIDSSEGKIQVSSAGHGSFLIFKRDKKEFIEPEMPNSVPLGVMNDSNYETLNFDMSSDDMLILYSDGVTEARDNSGKEFELEGIKRSIIKSTGNSAQKILKSLTGSLLEFSSKNAQHDDITIIICTSSDNK